MKRYPLSKTEYGIYIEQTSTQDTAYNLPLTIKLNKSTELDRLTGAVRAAVDAHAYLKTGFAADENGDIYKYQREFELDIPVYERDVFDPYEFVRVFDLHNDELIRCCIIRTAEDNFLFVDIHHIIFDGSSAAPFFRDINRAYNGEALEAESFTANDFAVYEQEMSQTEEFERQKQLYLSEFGDASGDTAFYTDKNERSRGAQELAYEIKSVGSDELKSLAKKWGVRLSTVMNTAFAYLLSGFSGSEQVIFSNVFNGRDERLSDTVGMFVKTLPVLAEINDSTKIGDILTSLDRQTTLCRQNSLYSYADLCSETGVTPSVLFGYQGDLFNRFEFCGAEAEFELHNSRDPKNVFELTVRRHGNSFSAHALYDLSQYNDALVYDMLESFDKVLGAMLTADTFGEIDMLCDRQREQLDKFNDNAFDYERTDMVTLFRRSAEKFPDNICVVFSSKRFTYREADRLSENIAAELVRRGVKNGDIVPIIIPRCEYMTIAALGVLKAGAGYQPLDASYPPERLSFMVKDTSAKVMIADRSLLEKVGDYEGDVLFTDEIPSLPDSEKLDIVPDPEDIFIILYTSGSTGVPKGVILEHRNLCAYCAFYKHLFPTDENSRAMTYASFGFDAHMLDTYPMLTSGGQLHIIPEEIRLDLLALRNYFESNGITHGFMTTQVGRQYAEMFADAKNPLILTTGGEKLVPVEPPKNIEFLNIYGPTECTIFTNNTVVDRLYDRVPIGKANENLKCYVVDKQMRRVPFGAPGELIIAGEQVGRGYINRPEQTEKVFIRNPFTDEDGYERAYRTGDIVRFLDDGRLDIVGRADGQVKIRGFRIELSEVEGVIRTFGGIKDATVQAFDDPAGGKFIAAYIVSDEKIDTDRLAEHIMKTKPAYMVPAVMMQIDKIPLNQNQKVNKRALPVPEKKAAEIVPVQNEMQKRIFDCVAKAIGNNDFGITTDIFEAGLTSIGSIKLNVLLSNEFGVPVNSKDLRTHKTVEELEKLFSDCKAESAYEKLADYPITFTQSGIFAECAAKPGSTVYNIPFLFRLSDKVDLEKLKAAVEAAADAHPYLKTTLFLNDEGDIRARRQDDAPFEVEVIRAEKLPEQISVPFELIDGELFRAKIFETDEANYLFLEAHHIISDGESGKILMEDINKAYAGEKLTPETYSGFEAALDEQKARNSESYEKAKAYFKEIFDGADTELMPSGDENGEEPKSGHFRMESDLDLESIGDFCRQLGTTQNAFFNAAFAFVLGKYSYKEEAVYTTIYNGRSDSRLARSITMLVKTLPVYCELGGDTAVSDFITKTGEQLLRSMDNDIYSFAEISRELSVPADIMFVYQGGNMFVESIGGEPAEMMLLDLSDAKAPVSVCLYITGGKAVFDVEFRSDMYSEGFMRRFTECIITAAKELTLKKKLRDVSIMSDRQRAIIEQFNATEHEIPHTTANKLFEEQVRLHPDTTAVISGDTRLTYKELNDEANKVAHTLINDGCETDEMIGVMMPRTAYAYAAREGIMKAGSAFMPMAPDYPDDRVRYILENSSAKRLVTTDAIAKERSELFRSANIKVITMEQCAECDDTSDPENDVKPDNLCYCLYTSGSTGNPKGAMIEHHSLVNFVHHVPVNVQCTCMVDNSKVMLALAALTFDVSVLEETLTLYHGHTIAMASEDEINSPVALAEMMKKNGVEAMVCTPSYMNNILDIPQAVSALRQLNAIELGAESFPVPLYEKIRNAGITAKLYNGYGPTEATVACTTAYLPTSRITIGKALCNTKIVMLDKYDNEMPVDVPGELTIIGEGVGRGYVANEKLNKEKYITYKGKKAYRVGDLARIAEDGNIIFMGRMDNQVKLRGLRIELDEIENVMNTFPSLNRSVVIVRDDEGKGQYLCAYFTADVKVDVERLKAHISKKLAKYMVPSVFIQLDAIPLTKNGKVDKKSLPKPEGFDEKRVMIPPKNELQKTLCEIFSYALGNQQIGINENFFEMGGTSLSASKIAIKAMAANLPIAFKDVFDYPTVESMEEYIKSTAPAESHTAAQDDKSTQNDALAHNTAQFVEEIRPDFDTGDILLTGATGYLGIHVLKCLLDTTDKTVYCLIRGSSCSEEERLRLLLMYYFENPMKDLFGSRIKVVKGDITDLSGVMALEELDFGTVINCAACVKHFAQDDTLDRINRQGVENLIELCVKTGRRLVQISTISIAGTSVNNSIPAEKVIHENELFFGQNLDNKYTHTKFKAEKAMLEAAAERGLDAKIIRVGNLMSRYSDGEFQINFVTNSFMRTLRAYAALGAISVAALDQQVEFSPIDKVAEAVVSLSRTDKRFTVFHATNSHRIEIGDVIQAMNEAGIPVETVTDEVFGKRFRQAMADEKKSSIVSPLIAYQVSDKNTIEFMIGYDNSFTTKALYRLGFKWPMTDTAYLNAAINALMTLSFFEDDEE